MVTVSTTSCETNIKQTGKTDLQYHFRQNRLGRLSGPLRRKRDKTNGEDSWCCFSETSVDQRDKTDVKDCQYHCVGRETRQMEKIVGTASCETNVNQRDKTDGEDGMYRFGYYLFIKGLYHRQSGKQM